MMLYFFPSNKNPDQPQHQTICSATVSGFSNIAVREGLLLDLAAISPKRTATFETVVFGHVCRCLDQSSAMSMGHSILTFRLCTWKAMLIAERDLCSELTKL